MSDDETRREDARIEAAIDRALKDGIWGTCWYCGDPTPHKDPNGEPFYRWLCRPCERMMADPGD